MARPRPARNPAGSTRDPPESGDAQRAAGVADRAQHPQRRVVVVGGVRGGLAAPAHQQVDLHVHQPGQQDQLAEIQQLTIQRPAGPFGTADTGDQRAVDPDQPRPHDLPRVEIEQPGGLQREHGPAASVPGHTTADAPLAGSSLVSENLILFSE
jgi:hypothetical protein